MHERLAKAAVAALRCSNPEFAKRLIADPDATAPALYAACNCLLGPTWRAWEPETIWHELDRHGGAEVNHAKVTAVAAVAQTGAPWWSWQGFAACADSFSGTPIDPSGLVPPEPTELAAAVPELQLLYAMAAGSEDGMPEWSDEVEAYIAAALAYHGFCVAPSELAFVQSRLEKLLSPEGCATAAEAKKETAAEGESKDSTPTAVSVARERLAHVAEYVRERQERCADQLEKL